MTGVKPIFTYQLLQPFFQAVLAVAFEGVLSASNARNEYLTFMDEYMANRRKDGEPIPKYEYDKFNWRYIFGLPPDLLLDEESLEYIPEEVYNKKRRKTNPKRRRNRNKNNVRGKKTKCEDKDVGVCAF